MTAGHGIVLGADSDTARACAQRLRDQGLEIVEIGRRDVGDRARADKAIERALAAAGGQIEVLVTSSDVIGEGSIEATGEEEFARLLEANLTAVFRAGRACFGPMRSAGGGSIIHVAGDDGIRAAHEHAVHSVTSAGVIAVAELFAAEGAAYGIRANAVCPGGSATAQDVAAVVAWLASAEAAHVSGATLRVDDAAGATMAADTRG